MKEEGPSLERTYPTINPTDCQYLSPHLWSPNAVRVNILKMDQWLMLILFFLTVISCLLTLVIILFP